MDNKSEPNFDSQFEELTTEWRTLRNLTIEVAGGFRGSWEKMFEMRISFFDKLILLSSGTFALSLTMLGSLHSHAASGNPLVGIGYLKRAWVLMLVSILM